MLERIVFSRELSEEEYILASIHLLSILHRYNQDSYYYVDIRSDQHMSVLALPEEEVHWQANELMCTDREAVIALLEYEGFYEELQYTLWKNNIGDLNRYIAHSEENIIHGTDPEPCIAKTEQDAYFYFNNILGILDILTVREDNEETF